MEDFNKKLIQEQFNEFKKRQYHLTFSERISFLRRIIKEIENKKSSEFHKANAYLEELLDIQTSTRFKKENRK